MDSLSKFDVVQSRTSDPAPNNHNFKSQVQIKTTRSHKCRKHSTCIFKGIMNVIFTVSFVVFIILYFTRDSSDLQKEVSELKETIQQLKGNKPFINTFCKDKIDGNYQHPFLQQYIVSCLDNSIYIGDIISSSKFTGRAIQTMVKYHQFYKDQRCKNLILRDLNSFGDYHTPTPQSWNFKGINQFSIILIMEKQNGLIQNWGFHDQDMPTPQASDKVANLDRILNLQKPIRYKFVNSIPFCYFSVNQVSTCYKQLYINLSSDEPYKIKSLWDAESMINHTTGDNEIYYQMQLYCQGQPQRISCKAFFQEFAKQIIKSCFVNQYIIYFSYTSFKRRVLIIIVPQRLL